MGSSTYKYYSREKHARGTLADVHNDVISKIQEEDVGIEVQQAQVLETFLRALKMVKYASQTNASQDAIDEVEKLGYDIIVKDILENTNFKFSGLFSGGGTSFERVFAKLQEESLKNLSDGVASKDFKDFMVGEIKSVLDGAGDSGTYTLNEGVSGLTKKWMKVFLGKRKNKAGQYIFQAVDQKVDNQGFPELNITYSANLPLQQQAMALLVSKNFSLKNYSSVHKNDTELSKTTTVTIGTTTPFRAIMSVLSTLGISHAEMLSIFFQGANSIAKGGQAAAYHFNHMQVMYEYMGTGQKIMTADGEIIDAKTVDFLVINDPQTTDIQVFSTKAIVYNAIHEAMNNTNNTFNRHVSILRGNSTESYRIRGNSNIN